MPEVDSYISDATGEITDTYLTAENYVTDVCNIRHLEPPRDSANIFATTVRTPNGSSVTDSITCGGDDYFTGQCYWHLKRNELSNGLERVYDDSTSQVEDSQSCSSTSAPSFIASSGSGFDQQNGFFWGSRARHYLNQDMFSVVPPNWGQPHTVEYTMHSNEPFSRYKREWNEVHIHDRDRFRIETLVHEYGHHTAKNYGLGRGTCVSGTFESQELNETFAQLAAMVVYVDDGEFLNATYQTEFTDSGSDPHLSTGPTEVDDGNKCNEEEHDEGDGLEVAIWELLWNRNCSAGCTSSTTTHGNGIFRQPSSTNSIPHENVINAVAAALAFGLANTPDNTTYGSFVSSFLARIEDDFDVDTSVRANLVLSHHGH